MPAKSYEEKIDEILQSIWMLKEYDRTGVADLVEFCPEEGVEADLPGMVEGRLIRLENGSVDFQPAGHKRAEGIVRCHRLAEVLLTQLFGLEKNDIEATACDLEHAIDPRVAESICTLLGHPPICPDGKPIPPGSCCRTYEVTVKPIVQRLSDMAVGATGKVTFIAPSVHSRFDLLASLGIVPGTIVRLHQKIPAYVIQTGETELAIDKDLTREIFVQKQ